MPLASTRRLPTTESLHLPPENRTFALTRGYTALGHDASLTYPDTAPGTALSLAFAPNALGQPTQAGSHAISATYHPNGQIKGFSYGNGLKRSVTQNARGLPSRILDQYSGGKRLDHTLTYDPNANLAGLVDGLDGAQESRTFQYDARDRLIQTSATPSAGSYTETWAYDPLDRIRRVTQPGRDWRYHYDAGTFLLSEIRNPANAPQRSYAWSARGEWTTRTWHSAGNPGFTPPTIFRNGFEEDLISTSGTFTFDNAERLVSANGITHRYDAHGRRVVTTEPQWGTRLQVYDRSGALRYAEDSASNERTEYVHLSGQLVGERSRPLNATTPILRYLHSDQRGTPSVKTASNRDVIYRSWNDAYGEPHDHLWRDGPGFTGHAMDPANQLVYMQQRYHDPETGFISPDPVAADHGSFNRYWYANNNPYRFVDPDGGQSVPVTTTIPRREQTRTDRAAISAGNRAQRLYERAAVRSGDQRIIDSYNNTNVEYRRELSPRAQSIQNASGQSSDSIKAYREPGEATISLLPGFAEFGDSRKSFSAYHGMQLGQGGDATLFQVIAHEHGHVLDMQNMEPHDREATASEHSNQMQTYALPQLRRELRERDK